MLSEPALENYLCLFQGLGWDEDCSWCVCNSKVALPPGLPKALSQPLGATAVAAVGWAHPSLSGAAPRFLVDVSPEFTVCGQAHILLQTFSAGSMGSPAGGGVRRG